MKRGIWRKECAACRDKMDCIKLWLQSYGRGFCVLDAFYNNQREQSRAI